MDGKQFHTRVRGVVCLLLAVLVAFTWVLYDLQIRRGADFLAQSRRKIARTETVDAARGEILDRYGRVLVSNRTSYNVSLDTSLMGERRNDIILALLDICREEGVTWSDTLPLSAAAPFRLTLDEAGAGAKNNFEKLMETMKWTGFSDGETLMAKLREAYKVDPALPDGEARALVGVLYELNVRSKEVSYVAYVFAQDVDITFITKVKEAGLAGVEIDPTTVREYHTPYAAHLLGRVGLMDPDDWNIYKDLGYPYNASVGKEGVELAFEEYLHGESGVRAVETNTQGKIVSEYWVPDSQTGEPQVPQPGGNAVLTLDIKLQEVVERSLSDRIGELASTDKRGGAAVVMDVTDGSVLAMASYPTYDLSTNLQNYTELAQDPLEPLFNRATQGLYPPGSTYKMVVATGALQKDKDGGSVITRNTKVRCTGKYTYYKDYQPKCWIARQYGGSHGNETVTTAIRDSCNIFFYDTGRRLGIDGIEKTARSYGLGEKTGIELYEKTGHVAGPEYTESLGQKWNEGATLAAAIGQENNQFTPLQLCNYVATLANGGTHYSAHLLKEVKSSDYGQVVFQREPEVLNTVDLDPADCKAITEGMLMVTQPGGSAARYFQDLDVKVAAKTGSAQVSSATESNGLFVCFAPYDDPQIAIAVVVERGGSGATLSNIAVDILDYYFSTGNNMETVEEENTLLR